MRPTAWFVPLAILAAFFVTPPAAAGCEASDLHSGEGCSVGASRVGIDMQTDHGSCTGHSSTYECDGTGTYDGLACTGWVVNGYCTGFGGQAPGDGCVGTWNRGQGCLGVRAYSTSPCVGQASVYDTCAALDSDCEGVLTYAAGCAGSSSTRGPYGSCTGYSTSTGCFGAGKGPRLADGRETACYGVGTATYCIGWSGPREASTSCVGLARYPSCTGV